jgi:uncharacterized protein
MPWFEKKFDNRYSGIRHPSSKKIFSPKINLLSSLSITTKIILANALFFIGFYIALLFLGTTEEGYGVLLSNVALQPDAIFSGQKIWTIFTHMFMHANFTHLFVNMLSLMFIGNFVEKILGRKRFFWVYFIGGLVSAFFFITLAGLFGGTEIGARLFGNQTIFAVGASGAIFALGGLLAMLIPKLKVLVFFIIPMPMWLAMTFFMGFFWILAYSAGIPIGNSAHLGGLVTGLFYGVYLKYRYPKKTKMIARVFS